MKGLAVRAAGAAFSAVLAGCASTTGAPREALPEPVAAVLTIDNRSTDDFTIWGLHDGRLDRLDRVGPASVTRLVVPGKWRSQELQLIADQPGSRAGIAPRLVSQPVTVAECQRLEWSIEPIADHSTLAVYPVRGCRR